MKKIRGIGIAPKRKREFLGVREETWTDGEVHEVEAWRGVDRRVWIRFTPNFGFRWFSTQWSRRNGKRKVA